MPSHLSPMRSRATAWRTVVGALLATVAGGWPAAAADLPEIRARGWRRVVSGSYGNPEVITVKPNTPRGLEGELIEGFAALQRLRVEYVPVASGGERIPTLLAGKGDVLVGGLNVTDQR